MNYLIIIFLISTCLFAPRKVNAECPPNLVYTVMTGDDIVYYLANFSDCEILKNLIINQADAGNPITSLEVFSNLTTLNANSGGPGLEIRNTTELATLAGLENITTINNSIHIENNLDLGSIFLNNVNSSNTYPNLTIANNPNLTELNIGIPVINYITGNLSIINNPSLNSVNGFENIEYTGGLIITGNTTLTSVTPIVNSLTKVDNNIIIENNNISELDLNQVTSDEDGLISFIIKDNQNLATLHAPSNLENITGSLIITGNPINNFTGFNNLERVFNIDIYNILTPDFPEMNSLVTFNNFNFLENQEIESFSTWLTNSDLLITGNIVLKDNPNLCDCSINAICNNFLNSGSTSNAINNKGCCLNTDILINVCEGEECLEETCDGIDNNCNGLIDEGLNCCPLVLASCKVDTSNGCDGSIILSPTGGNAPYTFSWNTTPVSTTNYISNQCAGNYAVTITYLDNSTPVINVYNFIIN